MIADRHSLPDRGLAVLVALIMICSSSGCGVSSKYTQSQVVTVRSRPEGAQLWRLEGNKKVRFGRSPAPVHLEYEVSKARYNRWLWWSLTGVFGAMGGGGSWWATREEPGSRTAPLLLAILGAIGTTLGVVMGVSTELKQGRSIGHVSKTLWASYPGYESTETTLRIPLSDPEVTIVLKPTAPYDPASQPAANNERGVARPTGLPTIALFDIQALHRRFDLQQQQVLGHILAAEFAVRGRYRVVPMSQVRALASDRRKACDSPCKIKLARAMAAQKWLAPWLVSVGRRCRMTAVLYDLPTGTPERSVAADASCSLEALSNALREIARKLSAE